MTGANYAKFGHSFSNRDFLGVYSIVLQGTDEASQKGTFTLRTTHSRARDGHHRWLGEQMGSFVWTSVRSEFGVLVFEPIRHAMTCGGALAPRTAFFYSVMQVILLFNMSNLAFIDGQNLHLGTTAAGWKIDYTRFRVYLKEKYKVSEAYYHLGYVSEEQQELYSNIQKAGYILVFKEHTSSLKGEKKGNVDTDMVFAIMRNLLDRSDEFDKFILISGDGDYKKLVDYLIRKNRFLKVLFPNTKARSSLYNKIGGDKMDYLDRFDIRSIIEYKKRKSP